MTTEERQNFDAFQRKLQESPANRLGECGRNRKASTSK